MGGTDVGVCVGTGVGEASTVGVCAGTPVGVGDAVSVGSGVIVSVAVGVGGTAVNVALGVTVSSGVAVAAGVLVAVALGWAVGEKSDPNPPLTARTATSSTIPPINAPSAAR